MFFLLLSANLLVHKLSDHKMVSHHPFVTLMSPAAW